MDVRTLFFVEASLLFLFSLTMVVSSIGQKTQASNYWFAASNFCGAVGLGVHSSFSPSHRFITIVLANFLLFVELSILNKAIAEFMGHGRHMWLFFLALTAGLTWASVYAVFWHPNSVLVVDYISIVTISTATCNAVLLFRYAADGLKPTMYVMGTLFAVYAANNLVRMMGALADPSFHFYHIWLDRTVIALVSFGYLLLTSARLRSTLEHQASTDHLTGALNRRAMERETLRMVTRKHPRPECISVLMLDVDYFKEINDTYGHHGGDLALRVLADCLRETMRTGDLIARLGGDEFLVVMSGTSAEEAEVAAMRLSEGIAELRVSFDGAVFGLRASIGITTVSSRDFRLEDLMKLSDRALYKAKTMSRRAIFDEPERSVAEAEFRSLVPAST